MIEVLSYSIVILVLTGGSILIGMQLLDLFQKIFRKKQDNVPESDLNA